MATEIYDITTDFADQDIYPDVVMADAIAAALTGVTDVSVNPKGSANKVIVTLDPGQRLALDAVVAAYDPADGMEAPLMEELSHKGAASGYGGLDEDAVLEQPAAILRTTTAQTDMAIGEVADGEYLKRDGEAVVGGVPAGGGDFVGPAGAVADNFLSFNGPSGKTGKDSGVAVARIPTQDQKDALAGTSGTPETGNEFVTNDDTRNTNARTPTAHTHTHAEATGKGPDDHHPQTHTIDSHDTNATGTQMNTLVGGGETTLHSHPGGGGASFEPWFFPARKLISPTNASWPVLGNATFGLDDLDTDIGVRSSDQVLAEGYGIEVPPIPAGFATMTITQAVRPQAAPAGAVVAKTLFWAKAVGTTTSAWAASVAMDDIPFPITSRDFVPVSTTMTLAEWGVAVGETYLFMISRTSVGSTLDDDLNTRDVTIGFAV